MEERLLTRITNVGLLAAVGMGVAHLVMPTRATAGFASRVAFVASVAGTGALMGWRERRARENAGDERVHGALWVWIVWGVISALALASLAFWLMHGSTK